MVHMYTDDRCMPRMYNVYTRVHARFRAQQRTHRHTRTRTRAVSSPPGTDGEGVRGSPLPVQDRFIFSFPRPLTLPRLAADRGPATLIPVTVLFILYTSEV